MPLRLAVRALALIIALPLLLASPAEAVPRSVSVTLDPKIISAGTTPAPAADAAARGVVKVYGDAGDKHNIRVQRRAANSTDAWETFLSVIDKPSGGFIYFDGTDTMEYRAVMIDGTNVYSNTERYRWTSEFSDEFGGASLDTTKWQYVDRGEADPYSAEDPSLNTVGGGVLTQDVKPDPAYNDCSAPYGQDCHVLDAYLRGVTSVAPPVAGESVWFASRVKFHQGRGAHSAFWANSGYGTGQLEVDFAEWFGQGSNEMLWSNIYGGGGPDPEEPTCDPDFRCERIQTPLSFLPAGENWWNTYHVFSGEWTTAGVYIFIDGKYVGLLDEFKGTVPTRLRLTQIVRDWENQYLDHANLSTKYKVRYDWVKVWRGLST